MIKINDIQSQIIYSLLFILSGSHRHLCTYTVAQVDFRSTSVMPVVVRVFHRILDKRLEVVPLKSNSVSSLVDPLLRTSTSSRLSRIIDWKKKSDLYISFFDFRKAFDSLYHQVLIAFLKGLAFPPGLVQYIDLSTAVPI